MYMKEFISIKVICQSFHDILLTPMKTPIALSFSHSLDSNRVIYHHKRMDKSFVTDITDLLNKINVKMYLMFSKVTRCSLSLGSHLCIF